METTWLFSDGEYFPQIKKNGSWYPTSLQALCGYNDLAKIKRDLNTDLSNLPTGASGIKPTIIINTWF